MHIRPPVPPVENAVVAIQVGVDSTKHWPPLAHAMKLRILILAVALLAIILWLNRYREPAIDGKTVSHYLAGFASDECTVLHQPPFALTVTFQPSESRRAAWETLPKFGTNAFPTMIKWLQARDGRLTVWLNRLWSMQSVIRRQPPLSAFQKRRAAVTAFALFGTKAEPTLPILSPLVTDPRFAHHAIYALKFVNPGREEHVLILTNWLDKEPNLDAVFALGDFGPRASKAVSLLIGNVLTSTNPVYSAAAAVALAKIRAEAEHVVPLISRNLEAHGNVDGI